MTTTTKSEGGRGGFGTLLIASTASNLGDGVLLAAVPLVARRATSDPLTISLVTAAATLPWLLFGLLAGAVVDRTDRWRAMVRSDNARAAGLVAFALLAWRTTPNPGVLIVLVFALGAAETVFDTAAQAALPSLVAEPQLERANGRLFGAQIATNGFIGPPLGALLFASSPAAPFALDALTFLASALLLRRLYERRGPTTPRARSSIRSDIAEGLSWLWVHPGVRAFALGAAIVNLAHHAALGVIVVLVRDELASTELAFAICLTGGAVGSLVGTQVVGPLVARTGRHRAVLLATATFSISLLLVALATSVVAVGIGLALFGVASEVWNVVAVSYRQTLVPDRLLGRVMASYRVIAYGAMPVGAALGGAATKVGGIRTAYFGGAAAAGVLFLYFASPSRAQVLRT